eukprot:3760147-Rhodomonas_salina.2
MLEPAIRYLSTAFPVPSYAISVPQYQYRRTLSQYRIASTVIRYLSTALPVPSCAISCEEADRLSSTLIGW